MHVIIKKVTGNGVLAMQAWRTVDVKVVGAVKAHGFKIVAYRAHTYVLGGACTC
jgi:hypothetical protein